MDLSLVIATHHIFSSCELLMNLVRFKSRIYFYEYISLENHVGLQVLQTLRHCFERVVLVEFSLPIDLMIRK